MSKGYLVKTMSEQLTPDAPQETQAVKQKLTLGGLGWRVGCLVIWLPLILLPIVMFNLAVNGEIVIPNGAGMPEPSAHPWLKASLIMDIDTRGLNITRSSIASTSADGLTCVQTDVSFALWAGTGEAVRYCDCYQKSGEDWTLMSTTPGVCGS